MREATKNTAILEREEETTNQPVKGLVTSQLFWENQRLIPFDLPEAQEAHKYLEKLTKELLGDRHDFENDPIDFVIQDINQPNAFYLPRGAGGNDRHVISVTKALVDMCDSEDELMAILGHEATHMLMRNRYTDLGNSKGVESVSDMNGAELLHECGRDPRAAKTIHEKLNNSKEKIKHPTLEQDLAKLIDVHPTDKTRDFNMDAILNVIQGGQTEDDEPLHKRTPLPFPDGIKETFAARSHISYMDVKSHVEDYEKMSIPERYDFIVRHLDEIEIEHNGENTVVDARANDLVNRTFLTREANKPFYKEEYYKNNSYSNTTEETKQELIKRENESIPESIKHNHPFIKEVIKKYAEKEYRSTTIGRILNHFTNTDSRFHIREFDDIPDFKRMNDDIKSFLKSESYEDAIKAAETLLSSRDEINIISEDLREAGRRGVYNLFAWDNFTLPDQENAIGETVPWNDFIDWSNEDESNTIEKVLVDVLGVKDYRLSSERENRHKNENEPRTTDGEIFVGDSYQCDIDTDTGIIKDTSNNYKNWKPKYYENNLHRTATKVAKTLKAVDKRIQDTLSDDTFFSEYDQATALEKLNEIKEVKQRTIINGNSIADDKVRHILEDCNDDYIRNNAVTDTGSFPTKNYEKLTKVIGEENASRLLHYDKEIDDQVLEKFMKTSLFIMQNEADKDEKDVKQDCMQEFIDGVSNRDLIIDICTDEQKDRVLEFFGIEHADKLTSHDYINLLSVDKMFEKELENIVSQKDVLTVTDEETGETYLDYSKYTPLYLNKIREKLGYKEPQNADDISALADMRREQYPLEDRDIYERAIDWNRRRLQVPQNIEKIIGLEQFIYASRTKNDDFPIQDLAFLMTNANELGYDKLHIRDYQDKFIKNKDNWPDDLEDKLECMVSLKRDRLFKFDRETYNETAKWLLSDIQEQPIDDRIDHAAFLLRQHNRFDDPELREQAVSMWTDAILEKHGKDDGSDEYKYKIMPYINSAKWNPTLGDRPIILDALSTKLVSQSKLAAECKSDIDLSSDDFRNSQASGVLGETLLTLLDRDDDIPEAFIDFLSGPSNTETCSQFRNSCIQKQQELYTKAENSPFTGDYGRLLPDRVVEHKTHPTDFDTLHRDFWAAPLPARAAVMARIMKSANGDESTWEDTFKIIDEKFIDKSDPDAKRASDLLHSYVKARGDHEREFLLAGMITASQSFEGKKVKIGKALKNFLEIMDPATVKIGQAAHSHPDTPDDIKKDLDGIKGNANKPMRHEIHEWIEKDVPKEVRDEIAEDGVGEVLGSGSYFVTVEITKKDGSETVLSLLRPNARADAEYGFEVLQKTTENMVERSSNYDPIFKPKEVKNNNDTYKSYSSNKKSGLNVAQKAVNKAAQMIHTIRTLPRYKNIASSIDQMIVQAKKMSGIEVSCNKHGINQERDAHKLYDGLEVTVEDYQFQFETMSWKSYGPNYKEMEKAEGVPFNKLPENTPEEKKFKQSFAKGYAAVEFINILRGGKFDHDKHGEQLNVAVQGKKGIVGIYDTGAMAIKEPTKEEKLALGKAIGSMVRAGMTLRSPLKAFDKQVDKMVDKGQDSTYLIEAKKAVLALGDFTSQLAEKKEKSAAGKAFASGVNAVAKGVGFKPPMSTEKTDATLLKQVLACAIDANVLDEDIKKGIGITGNMVLKHILSDKGDISIKRNSPRKLEPAIDYTDKMEKNEAVPKLTLLDKAMKSDEKENSIPVAEPELLKAPVVAAFKDMQAADTYFIKEVSADR